MPDKSLISRRAFLESSALAGGSVASLSHASGEPFPNRTATSSAVASSKTYYPSPEWKDGWRRCRTDDEVRQHASMGPKRLDVIGHVQQVIFEGPWAIVVVRNGYLAWEAYGVPAFPSTTFDIWSCTKSLTATAFGWLFIVPSLDLVVVHVGFRLPQWPEDLLLAPVVDSIIGQEGDRR